MKVTNQPEGRMTILALPDHLQGDWDEPQEVEVRLAGDLIVYGLTNGTGLQRMQVQCGNPDCDCPPREYLRLEIEIAPCEGEQ